MLIKELGFSCVCARWVPRLLMRETKDERVRVCKIWCDKLAEEEIWFDNVITFEAWMHCQKPAMKQATSCWLKKGSEPPLKQKATKSGQKCMAITFFDHKGVIFTHWVPQGQEVNKEYMIKVLKRVYIQNKRPEMMNGRFKVHMDNVRPHVAKIVLEWLHKHGIEVVRHPAYSPDLAPNDFFLYPMVKKVIKGQRYSSIEQLKKAVHTQLIHISKNRLKEAFEKWQYWWEKCIALGAAYVERNL